MGSFWVTLNYFRAPFRLSDGSELRWTARRPQERVVSSLVPGAAVLVAKFALRKKSVFGIENSGHPLPLQSSGGSPTSALGAPECSRVVPRDSKCLLQRSWACRNTLYGSVRVTENVYGSRDTARWILSIKFVFSGANLMSPPACFFSYAGAHVPCPMR